nr:MAG TPA: hypothetical protein [Caudoviricetes sp.]
MIFNQERDPLVDCVHGITFFLALRYHGGE